MFVEITFVASFSSKNAEIIYFLIMHTIGLHCRMCRDLEKKHVFNNG